MPTNEKIQKINFFNLVRLKSWELIKREARLYQPNEMKYIDSVISASALIAKEEQKKKDAVIVARIQAGVCSRIPSNQKTIELLDEARRKILNQ